MEEEKDWYTRKLSSKKLNFPEVRAAKRQLEGKVTRMWSSKKLKILEGRNARR